MVIEADPGWCPPQLQRTDKVSFQFLQHYFEVENKDGSKDVITSTLCEYGAPIGSGGYSAMAKLVGIPCGVGKLLSRQRF